MTSSQNVVYASLYLMGVSSDMDLALSRIRYTHYSKDDDSKLLTQGCPNYGPPADLKRPANDFRNIIKYGPQLCKNKKNISYFEH